MARTPTSKPSQLPGTRNPGRSATRGASVGSEANRSSAGRLVRQLGTPVPGLDELGLTHTFPSATVVADSSLSGLGLTGARITALGAFAAAVRDGAVRLDGSVSLDDFVASVVELPGLGDWTAQYLALRLGEPDAFPAGDLGLRKALANGDVATAREAEQQAESWRPWRASAAIHLWAMRP